MRWTNLRLRHTQGRWENRKSAINISLLWQTMLQQRITPLTGTTHTLLTKEDTKPQDGSKKRSGYAAEELTQWTKTRGPINSTAFTTSWFQARPQRAWSVLIKTIGPVRRLPVWWRLQYSKELKRRVSTILWICYKKYFQPGFTSSCSSW